MKNKDLNSETAKKIIESSTELFNVNGYSGTSISDISKKADISKGIIYHYFEDKDALYLHCVKQCVEDFSNYMNDNSKGLPPNQDMIISIIKFRLKFFEAFPQYSSFLNNIIALKPNHLSEEISHYRTMMRNENLARFKQVTKDVKFGKGITDSDILAFLTILQNNAYFIGESSNGMLPETAVDRAIRITKIFINGLKTDIE